MSKSNGNLTGLAAIVAKSRKTPESQQTELQDTISLTAPVEQPRAGRAMERAAIPLMSA